MNKPKLTKHIRHARLVKIARRSYQELNPGARLFNNTSGTAWQGLTVSGAKEVILKNPRIITFGIPGNRDGSGGADLLGWTIKDELPIFTAVECKSGNGRLMKNQVIFRKIILNINGIYRVARECPTCWDDWTPIYKSGKIIEWIPVESCPHCRGLGYILEE